MAVSNKTIREDFYEKRIFKQRMNKMKDFWGRGFRQKMVWLSATGCIGGRDGGTYLIVELGRRNWA